MSNRLTFSLASLIVLILFGATSVMAHPPGTADSGGIGNMRSHGHPTNGLPAMDGPDNDTTAGNSPGEAAVPAHDEHPTVSSVDALPGANSAVGTKAYQNRKVVLLNNATATGVVIPLDPIPTAEPGDGVFKVRVTFKGTLAELGEGSTLATNEVTVTARRPGDKTGPSLGVTHAVAAVTGAGNENKFDVTITVPQSLYWTAAQTNPTVAAKVNLPIEVFLSIGSNAVATQAGLNKDGFTTTSVGNEPYSSGSAEKFTVVKSLVPTAVVTNPTKKPDPKVDGTYDLVFRTDKAVENVGVKAEFKKTTGLSISTETSHQTSITNNDAGYMLEVASDASKTEHTVNVKLLEPTETKKTYPAGSIEIQLTYESQGVKLESVVFPFAAPARTFALAPFFPKDPRLSTVNDVKIWANVPYNYRDTDLQSEARAGERPPILPRADAREGVDIGYKVRPVPMTGTNAKGAASALPTGFQLIHDDSERRRLHAPAPPVLAKKKFEYLAHNVASSTGESRRLEFSIEVIPQIVPTAPGNVMAIEDGLQGLDADTTPIGRERNQNKVYVSWEKPVDSTPGITGKQVPFGAPISGYRVTRVNPDGTTHAYHATTPLDATARDFTTPDELDLGEYTFKVVAVNSIGDGAEGTDKVEVMNPPSIPRDLRFVLGEGDDLGKVSLNWKQPTNEGDADGGIDDDKINKYLVILTEPNTGTELRRDYTEDIEPDSDQVIEYEYTEKLAAGSYVPRVSAINADDVGEASTANTPFTIPGDPVNNPPTFADGANIANIVATVDVAIDAKILPEATDKDKGDTLTYSIDPDLPDGLDFDDETRALTGTPTDEMAQTPYTYKVSDDNKGEATLTFFITVNAAGTPVNAAPTFADGANIANIVATVGQAIDGRILPKATDDDSGDTLYYSIDPDLPDGLAFDDETRALTGTPTDEMAQTVHTYTVRDREAATADDVQTNSLSFFITVNAAGTPVNAAPVFAADANIANIVATVGQAIDGRFLPEATDTDSGDTLTYAITPALPDGLNFDPMTRALTGTPTDEMAQTPYTYKVRDRENATADDVQSDSLNFFITVNAATAGPGTGTPTATLPAKGYLVYVRSLANAPVFGTSNPAVAEWSGMPDLYALFTEGGGGSLQLNVTGVDARKVVMTEVMWAVDEGKVGQNSYTGQQWIEVYNTTDTAIPATSISFATGDGRPALAQGTDLISNVVGGGSAWIRTKGQNGNSGAADGSGKKEFISMYRKERGKNGWDGGHWAASTNVYHPNHKGTPGKGEATGPKIITASGVVLGTIFNEIANHPSGNHKHEWIELRKREGELSNLENWVVDMVTGVNAQKRLFKIPKLNEGRYGDLLLITKTDPARDDNHPLRGGYNVEKDDADQSNEGRDKNIRYYVADDWTTDLPDNGEFVLILRHGADKTNHEKVEDIAGYHPNLKVDDANTFTNLWPLLGYAAPNIALNKIDSGKVHRRQKDNIPGTKTADKADNAGHVALRDEGWKGVGYKRNADAGDQNGGTPGYPNNAVLSNETQAGADPVIISEVMYATGDRGNIPQWIELRNTSQTAGVNLDGWRVTIVNHDQDIDGNYAGDLNKSYNINGKIPPGQTFLVVAHSGTDNTNLPSERIVSIAKRRGDLILSQYGFEITVETKEKDGKRGLADQVGNLVDLPTGRVRVNYQSYEEPAWMLPAGTNDNGDRVSIVRTSIKGTIQDGKLSDAWKLFDMSAHINAPESTYYGNRNDLASPGYTNNGVLPVSLSKFRPERMKDTGQVVIRWVTESELNNAGFNILRGKAIDGEFTKLNKQLIAGQGTTSEKTSYTFVDKSAKPNVVYYYQIQDVSLEGQVQTLRTTHLRGNVSAVGKLTTTWGELKALQ